MNYRSFSDLNDQIVRMVATLPSDIDVVVGIPRSGLLAANLIAIYLNVPMTDVEGLVGGRLLRCGERYDGDPGRDFLGTGFLGTRRNILVVDDSVSFGGQMRRVKAEIAGAGLPHRVHYAAVFITPQARDEQVVDHFAEVLDRPRVFEWNVMHHRSMLKSACVEMDGVLCRVPTAKATAAGYRDALEKLEPLWIPRSEIGWVVTARPEKYREVTEAWLSRHGVSYAGLLMMPDDEAHAGGVDTRVRFKADAYVSNDGSLLFEHSFIIAERVAKLSNRSVYCVQTREMIQPGSSSNSARLPRSPLAQWFVDRYHRTVRYPRLLYQKIHYRWVA